MLIIDGIPNSVIWGVDLVVGALFCLFCYRIFNQFMIVLFAPLLLESFEHILIIGGKKRTP